MAEYICSSCGCTIESEADPQGKIRGRLRIGGIPWPEGKTARIAFSAFDASGAGGRYPVLRKLSAECGEDTPFRTRELFLRYLMEHYPPSAAGGNEK